MAEPIQLPLFPDQAALTRIRPERNEWRFYRLAVWPDLFGRALLARQWGRIGTQGRVRLDPHPDAGATINALARLVRAKPRLPGQSGMTVRQSARGAVATKRTGHRHQCPSPHLPPASVSTRRTVSENTSPPARGPPSCGKRSMPTAKCAPSA